MYSVHPYTTRKRVHNTKLAQIQVLCVSLRDVTWNLSSGNLTMTVEDQTNAEGQMHFTWKLWCIATNLHKDSFSRTTLQWLWTIINNFLRSNLILHQPSLAALQHNMHEFFIICTGYGLIIQLCTICQNYHSYVQQQKRIEKLTMCSNISAWQPLSRLFHG